jgi:hypothetical protein
MKKSILFLLVLSLIAAGQANAQGGLLKKVAKSMSDELIGKSGGSGKTDTSQPEPSSACNDAETVVNLGGKLQIDYTEMSISVLNDGRILLKHRFAGEYYVVKDGVTTGPLREDDPRVAEFEPSEGANTHEAFIARNKPYISKSGDKLLITFAGKTYGPYAVINNFTVSKSKDKFAAICTESIVVTEDQGAKMDAAMKNAKTDQERMDLAMQYASQMQQKMVQAGGAENTLPKFVTNVPGATFNPLSTGGTFSGDMKYDDILVTSYNSISDLTGKKLFALKTEDIGAEQIFVNTSGTKYAVYNYGTLTISDKTTLSELFSPYLKMIDGKVYIAYMYYSPKKNSIMQCKIAF